MAEILMIHSYLRWLVVTVALIACIKLLIGWRLGTGFRVLDGRLLTVFCAAMDLQVLVGLVYLLWSGLSGPGFPHYRLEHTVIMIIAVFFAHLPARWKSLDDRVRFRRSFFAVLVALAMVFAGISRLPGGWTR